MAVGLSVTAQSLLKQVGIQPQIALSIEGVDTLYAAQPVFKTLEWDDSNANWDDNLNWDGTINDPKAVDWISLQGTTTSITQQIRPDKGSTSSIATVNIAIVDVDGKVSKALSFDAIAEILGKKATFSIGFFNEAAVYPEDYQAIFRGVVVDFYTEAGIVMVSLASSESLKRQVFLEKQQTELTARIKYRELDVQNIRYTQRSTTVGLFTIEYVNSASLSVSYNSGTNKITVNMISGVTTAKQIVEATENEASTFFAVEASVVGNNDDVPQISQAVTSFIIDTIINVNSTVGLYGALDSLSTYYRVNDELVEVTSIISETQAEVVRGQLNTLSVPHENESECESFYRLQGKPLDLSLKIMLSEEGNEYFSSDDVPKSVNFISRTEQLANTIIFDYYDIKEKTGLVVGDTFQLDTTLNTNTYTIRGFGQLETGDSFIETFETLVTENEYLGTFKYKSKYNVLPTGLGMISNEVDIEEFENLKASFGSNFIDYDLYIKDSIDDMKTYMDSELFFPQGLYSIPRKARSSVKFVVPPFSSDILPTLDNNTITNITKIKQRRSVHKYLYNTYVWRFNQDSLEDKFLTGKVVINNTSVQRIKVGKKQLKIESTGLRSNVETFNLVNNLSQRLIDKYSLAPTYFEGVEVNYKTGYAVEVGDIIEAFPSETKTRDLRTGSSQRSKLYEVTNKSLNVKTGKIKLSLISSAFEIESRYVVVSLSSRVVTGSTDTRLIIEPINDLGRFRSPTSQWEIFRGKNIRVRSKDYLDDDTVTFEIDPTNNAALILDTPLSFTPSAGYIVEVPDYNDTDAGIDSEYKLQFGYNTTRVTITSVTDAKTFDVDLPDNLVVPSLIYVHSDDYLETSSSELIRIESIVGNTVTLESDLPFTPQINHIVDRSNFKDDGFPYTFI